MTLTNYVILEKSLYLPVSTSPSGKIEVIFYEHSSGSENQNRIYKMSGTKMTLNKWQFFPLSPLSAVASVSSQALMAM